MYVIRCHPGLLFANTRSSLTVVVTINILVKLPQFHGMLRKVKRLVLSLLGELVY
jgi:hypothetical protein